jgi:polar amino acid transport system substrate-binding protein
MFVGDKPIIGGGVGMGVRKSDTDLRNKFTAAIDSMKGDGTLNALITKHEISEQMF